MTINYYNYSKRITEHLESKTSFVTATLIGVRGSSPGELGTKIVVTESGLDFGTIGGGKLEARCIELSLELLDTGKHQFISYTWNLQKDIGMTCGGEVSVYFEVVRSNSRWKVAIFGAGHVCQALSSLLVKLDCAVSVIDEREEWIDKLPEHRNLTKICTPNMASIIETLADDTFIVIMTKGHSCDVPILYESITKRNFPYLGVIGSLPKRRRVEEALSELGLSKEDQTKFLCPMGERIGNNSPVEISISISAQLLKVRDRLAL